MAEKKEYPQDTVNVPVISLKALEDMTLAEVDALSTDEILEHLRRAELREKVMEIQRKRVSAKQASKDQEDAQKRAKTEEAAKKFRQANCPHRKGGSTGREDGNDITDYSLLHHILPSGTHMIVCTRCGKEEYSHNPLTGQAATAGFSTWVTLPTFNKTSGSTLFVRRFTSEQIARLQKMEEEFATQNRSD